MQGRRADEAEEEEEEEEEEEKEEEKEEEEEVEETNRIHPTCGILERREEGKEGYCSVLRVGDCSVPYVLWLDHRFQIVFQDPRKVVLKLRTTEVLQDVLPIWRRIKLAKVWLLLPS